jgi:hypothetical protein
MLVIRNKDFQVVYSGGKISDGVKAMCKVDKAEKCHASTAFTSSKRYSREGGMIVAARMLSGIDYEVLCIFPESASKSIRFGLHQLKNPNEIVYLYECSRKKLRLALEGGLTAKGESFETLVFARGGRGKLHTVEQSPKNKTPRPKFGSMVQPETRRYTSTRSNVIEYPATVPRFTGLHKWTAQEIANFAEKHDISEERAEELIHGLEKRVANGETEHVSPHDVH